jgi:hypothetical protein
VTTATYVFRDGQCINKDTGEVDRSTAWDPNKRFYVVGDIPAHMAWATDGTPYYLSSKSKLKDFESRHGMVPYERAGDLKDAPAGVYNPQCDKWQSWMKSKMTKVAEKAGLDASSRAIEERMRPQMKAVKEKVLKRSKQD